VDAARFKEDFVTFSRERDDVFPYAFLPFFPIKTSDPHSFLIHRPIKLQWVRHCTVQIIGLCHVLETTSQSKGPASRPVKSTGDLW